MKLRLTTSRCDRGFEQNEGDEIDVGSAEGKALLESGQAELVRGESIDDAAQRHSHVETAAQFPSRNSRTRRG